MAALKTEEFALAYPLRHQRAYGVVRVRRHLVRQGHRGGGIETCRQRDSVPWNVKQYRLFEHFPSISSRSH